MAHTFNPTLIHHRNQAVVVHAFTTEKNRMWNETGTHSLSFSGFHRGKSSLVAWLLCFSDPHVEPQYLSLNFLNHATPCPLPYLLRALKLFYRKIAKHLPVCNVYSPAGQEHQKKQTKQLDYVKVFFLMCPLCKR